MSSFSTMSTNSLCSKRHTRFFATGKAPEDAVHDAFLRVINHLSKFRSYSCKENVSYLVIIVRGIALNMVSKSNMQAELDEETPDGLSVEDSVLSELAYEEIVENIKALSPALRDIAYLSFVENCSAGRDIGAFGYEDKHGAFLNIQSKKNPFKKAYGE